MPTHYTVPPSRSAVNARSATALDTPAEPQALASRSSATDRTRVPSANTPNNTRTSSGPSTLSPRNLGIVVAKGVAGSVLCSSAVAAQLLKEEGLTPKQAFTGDLLLTAGVGLAASAAADFARMCGARLHSEGTGNALKILVPAGVAASSLLYQDSRAALNIGLVGGGLALKSTLDLVGGKAAHAANAVTGGAALVAGLVSAAGNDGLRMSAALIGTGAVTLWSTALDALAEKSTPSAQPDLEAAATGAASDSTERPIPLQTIREGWVGPSR